MSYGMVPCTVVRRMLFRLVMYLLLRRPQTDPARALPPLTYAPVRLPLSHSLFSGSRPTISRRRWGSFLSGRRFPSTASRRPCWRTSGMRFGPRVVVAVVVVVVLLLLFVEAQKINWPLLSSAEQYRVFAALVFTFCVWVHMQGIGQKLSIFGPDGHS